MSITTNVIFEEYEKYCLSLVEKNVLLRGMNIFHGDGGLYIKARIFY